MKKFYFLVLLMFGFILNAQIVNIPDANLKETLLLANTSNNLWASVESPVPNVGDNTWWTVSSHNVIDTNGDGEIQVSEAQAIKWLDIPFGFNDLTGLEAFTNLEFLNCSSGFLYNLDLSGGYTNLKVLLCEGNSMSSLNVSGLTNLLELYCDWNEIQSLNLLGCTNLKKLRLHQNQLTNLNLSGFENLELLDCSQNSLQSLNISGCTNLQSLNCEYNQLSSLDVSDCVNLNTLSCSDNDSIEFLNIKNGSILTFFSVFAPDIQYICADDEEVVQIQNLINSQGATNCNVNSYCNFIPGGNFHTIHGITKYDVDNDGCDVSDLAYSNLRFDITNGIESGHQISNSLGNCFFHVEQGVYTVTPVVESTAYFTVSPSSIVVDFPTQSSPFTQNFCVTTNGTHPDLEVVLVSTEPARPGFDTDYKLIFKNKGTHTQSGTLNLNFDDTVLDLVSTLPIATNQTTNNLSWDFVNLQPFETREIALTLNVNSPMETPAVNGGDILNFTATITSAAVEETPEDNTFILDQTVVNSYDPNDKTCLEGDIIAPSEVGKYVHYVIRFENTGTYPAENIVVKDMIDTAKFDVNSIVPIKGSHDFYTRINGNKVEFIFENINLPFDDANNDGYVAFKIKTKPTLVVGNTFSNSASIYFDYNFPIITNTATTTVQTLGTQDFDFNTYFALYPNPVSNALHIETKQSIEVSSISIYNQLGQLVVVVPTAQNVKTVDVSNLSSGSYFVKINSDKGTSNSKFIKQ
ncbi:T9SS type A sorting domain-containing protein [Flavobacterium sp.]|uniref:DUF7619 domain-containing protein n=1 Tax=Flavobacterium sp. TaxID=239 RepID=UPI0028BF5349|nr:T9SS type A sorting domain-containing protein [Flavobacterium sp.]